MIQEFHIWVYTKRIESRDSDICRSMFIAALFTITKVWKQLKCPLIKEPINKR